MLQICCKVLVDLGFVSQHRHMQRHASMLSQADAFTAEAVHVCAPNQHQIVQRYKLPLDAQLTKTVFQSNRRCSLHRGHGLT